MNGDHTENLTKDSTRGPAVIRKISRRIRRWVLQSYGKFHEAFYDESCKGTQEGLDLRVRSSAELRQQGHNVLENDLHRYTVFHPNGVIDKIRTSFHPLQRSALDINTQHPSRETGFLFVTRTLSVANSFLKSNITSR